MLEPLTDADRDLYASSGGASSIRPAALELFRLWWSLAEVAGYVDSFRKDHEEDANTREAWGNFQQYLPSPRPASGEN